MPKTLSSERWYQISSSIFASWGAPDDVADRVARSLVDAELAGFGSHGVLRIVSYQSYCSEEATEHSPP